MLDRNEKWTRQVIIFAASGLRLSAAGTVPDTGNRAIRGTLPFWSWYPENRSW